MGVQETHTSSSRFRCADCFRAKKCQEQKLTKGKSFWNNIQTMAGIVVQGGGTRLYQVPDCCFAYDNA
ncbi:unnamed protein product [Pleuronectes platessa]|uniref:Uncharacterized protein n=1 Tax=Pleuronectes platessa TaxID=8262 RepID=A0A9N7UJ34_PLEPL|nr:unnamed protein product [Pleuronectes platessa]